MTQEVSFLGSSDAPRFVFAPGRINVLGEHTDTSEGFSLPAAVGRGLLCAFAPKAGSKIQVVSLDVPGLVEVDSAFELSAPSASYGRYVAAVAAVLFERGIHVSGLVLALGSTIPAGGGMSSSAALCVALTMAMTAMASEVLPPLEVALVAQAAEHRVGVRCGLMDQYSIVFGREKQALLFDSRTLTHREVPLELGDTVLVVYDTRVPRGLVDSEYNARRSQVEEAARLLDGGRGEIRSLRDATPTLVEERRQELGELLFRRARHVVEENARTLAAAALFSEAAAVSETATDFGSAERARELGRLMNASHASLRDLFEVSCPELDELVAALCEQGPDLVLGARMMGGGFGGCVIALVAVASLSEVLERARERYLSRTGNFAEFFPVEISAGARLLTLGEPTSP